MNQGTAMKFERTAERNYEQIKFRLGLFGFYSKPYRVVGHFNQHTKKFTTGRGSRHRIGNARILNTYFRLKRASNAK